MEKQALLYEGKAKKVYATQDPQLLIVSYKDDATAFNGLKKGVIQGKGVINNQMSNLLMAELEKRGVPTHLVRELNPQETLVKRVSIVPLEVIVRNLAAGSFSKRYGVEEGLAFAEPVLEFSYKNDGLGDPLLNDDHAVALKLATREELAVIRAYALKINRLLQGIWADRGIILADEISPDTCRLWDAQTREKLDKDRFRRDLGGVEEAYRQVMERLSSGL